MIGLIYPGVCRLDYHAGYRGGIFPKHIESNNDPGIARWLERVLHLLPVMPRPEGIIRSESRISIPHSFAGSGSPAMTASTQSWEETLRRWAPR